MKNIKLVKNKEADRFFLRNINYLDYYSPDEEQKAIDLVLIQAEQFSEEWSVN